MRLSQLSCGDIAAIRLRFELGSGKDRNMTVGADYMPYDSEENLPLQVEVKKLVVYAIS
jgi:hypothetical protein